MTKTIAVKGIVIPNDYADVYDYLGYESISPSKIQDALNEAGNEDVTLEINSPGGYVDAGSEIYTDLKKYSGNINAQIVGQACSAASWIALAADNVEMSPTAQMMIHRASTVSQGNSDNLTSDLQALNSLDQSFVDLYAEKTGLDKQEVYQMMSATTWLNAQDAVDKGFADSIMFKQDNNLAIVNAAGEPALSKFAIDKIKNAIYKESEKPKEKKIENNSQLSNKFAILFGKKEEIQ